MSPEHVKHTALQTAFAFLCLECSAPISIVYLLVLRFLFKSHYRGLPRQHYESPFSIFLHTRNKVEGLNDTRNMPVTDLSIIKGHKMTGLLTYTQIHISCYSCTKYLNQAKISIPRFHGPEFTSYKASALLLLFFHWFLWLVHYIRFQYRWDLKTSPTIRRPYSQLRPLPENSFPFERAMWPPRSGTGTFSRF